VSTLPLASSVVAVNCTVCPTCMLAEAGLTTTEATGTEVTVIAAVPLFPSLVAVIVADPAATPLTSPFAETVATAGALLVHVTTRSLSGLSFASSGVAVTCTVLPTDTVADGRLIATDATEPFV